MSQLQTLYTGRAGQAFVMAEFAIRGYNVAVPEIDRGDDLFVVHDTSGAFWRVQVKTANAKVLAKGGFRAQFRVRLSQLQTPYTPDLTYVFATRVAGRWADCVVIPRDKLYALHSVDGVGTLAGGYVVLGLSYRAAVGQAGASLESGTTDLSPLLGDFSWWPAIAH